MTGEQHLPMADIQDDIKLVITAQMTEQEDDTKMEIPPKHAEMLVRSGLATIMTAQSIEMDNELI